MISKGLTKFLIGLAAVLIAVALSIVPMTLIVWYATKLMGFEFMLRQIIGAEILFTITMWWGRSISAAFKGDK